MTASPSCARAYDGWIVVEQDRVLGPAMTFPGALESARRNRAFLRDRGF